MRLRTRRWSVRGSRPRQGSPRRPLPRVLARFGPSGKYDGESEPTWVPAAEIQGSDAKSIASQAFAGPWPLLGRFAVPLAREAIEVSWICPELPPAAGLA